MSPFISKIIYLNHTFLLARVGFGFGWGGSDVRSRKFQLPTNVEVKVELV